MRAGIQKLPAIGFSTISLISIVNAATPQDNLVVTATRTPVASHRVIAPVDIIDSETISRSMAMELPELLRFQSGLDVVRVGGPGQQTSIFTRGTNSNHTLVLIDGVRINTGSAGGAAIQNIAPGIIERVEIVKSPRTTLYGENAIGGVINVITRNPDQTTFNGFAGTGQDNTQKYGVAAGTTLGGFSFTGQTQHAKTDGMPIVEGATFDSGWDNTTLMGRASYEARRWKLDGRAWISEGTTDYVGFPLDPASQKYDNSVIAVAGSAQLTDNWNSLLDLSFATDELRQNQSPDFAKTRRTTLDWQNTVTMPGESAFVAGVFVSNEEVEGESFGFPLVAEDTDTVAVYAEDSLDLGRHVILFAGRYSDNDAYGNDFTWNFEYGFDITADTRLTANAGRAVRAPSAAERFGAFGGNPDLKEEEALTVQTGWQWAVTEYHDISVDLFYTEIDNLIAGDVNFVLQNIETAEISGLEAGYSYLTSNWSIRATGVLQNPKNKTSGGDLLRRAEQQATLSLVRNFGPHQIGVDARFVGSRTDFGEQRLAGYGLINFTGRIAIGEHWSLAGRIENLLDRDYTPAFYDFGTRYRAPSRGAYVEIRYRLQ
jgi:vitamin B12 transporter